MDGSNEKEFTVQRRDTSVPAPNGERAGPMVSRSSNCKATTNATSGDEDIVLQNSQEQRELFRKSSKILRSPILNKNGPPEEVIIDSDIEEISEEQTTCDESECDRDEIEKMEERQYKKLIELTRSMIKATKIQPNVSKTIKQGLAEMEEALDIIRECRNQRVISRATTKTLNKTAKGKEKVKTRIASMRESASSINQTTYETPKRRRNTASSPNQEPHTPSPIGKKHKVHGDKQKNPEQTKKTGVCTETTEKPMEYFEATAQNAETAVTKNQEDNSASTSKPQANKFVKQKKRNRKPRPDAILVDVPPGQSYSDVLRTIRDKVDPIKSNTEVRAIRKTRNGQILITIEKQDEGKEAFSKAITEAVGTEINVKHLFPTSTLEIRDLDELATEADIKTAVDLKIGKTTQIKVKIFDPNNRGQRMALLEAETELCKKLLEYPRIKIGWVNCRLRERLRVIRCFRCLGYGHEARHCMGKDRRNMCYKCGSEEHKALTCKSKVRCVLCADKMTENLEHIPGSGSCQVFRLALGQMKNAR